MAYVQDSFLTNDVLQEMVSHLLVAVASGLMVSTCFGFCGFLEIWPSCVAQAYGYSFSVLSAGMTGVSPAHLGVWLFFNSCVFLVIPEGSWDEPFWG